MQVCEGMAKLDRWCSWAGFANLLKAKPLKCHMQAREGANRNRGKGILVPEERNDFEFFTSQIARNQLSTRSRNVKLLPLTARQ